MKKIILKEGQIVLDEEGNEYQIEKGDSLVENISSGFEDILKRDLKFRYQMLSRFVEDAKYYLNKSRHPKYLWSGNPIDHADNMVALYNTFSKSQRPEWLTPKELQFYVDELYKS